MNDTPVSATRMDAVQTPIVPIIGALLRQTPGAISLGQGVVHYGPPPEAAEAARAAIARSETDQYQDVAGLPALLDRIARKLAEENGIGAARGRIMVTAGANMAFMHAVLATTSPGDEVILPIPFYFNHEMAVQMAGCRVVCVPTDECYQLSTDAIARAISSRTRAIVTISPNNPSGAVYAEAALRRTNEPCRDRGLYHISDETYEYLRTAPHATSRPARSRAESTPSRSTQCRRPTGSQAGASGTWCIQHGWHPRCRRFRTRF
jgi:aspartate/methionine/tyrosine aminotransferase